MRNARPVLYHAAKGECKAIAEQLWVRWGEEGPIVNKTEVGGDGPPATGSAPPPEFPEREYFPNI